MEPMNEEADNRALKNPKSPINWEQVEQRCLDAESLKIVLPIFIENNDKYVSDLHQAWANGDKESMHSIAHTIKGTAGNVGAEALSHAAFLLDQECLSGNGNHAEALIQQIKQLHEELQIYISGLE